MITINLLTLCQLFEDLLDIHACSSTGRKVVKTQLSCVPLCLGQFDLSIIFEVTFVADYYDGQIRPKLLPQFRHPHRHLLERINICNIVHN